MGDHQLTTLPLDLTAHRLGEVQRSGAITAVPLFGGHGDNGTEFTPPLSGLKISRVRGYGELELENPSARGVAIVPLHIGYVQTGAQNHAVCRSAFIGAGQKVMFDDACCVQEAQGGYLEGKEQWFFILPVELRRRALELRGKQDYRKLWPDIEALTGVYGLRARGHLDELLVKRRPYLTQFASRLEYVPGQTGALFFLNGRLAGIEVGPTPEYFREVWYALVCFCYGPAAMRLEGGELPEEEHEPFEVDSLAALRDALDQSRQQATRGVLDAIEATPRQAFGPKEQERFLDMRLWNVAGNDFAGQMVTNEGRLLYASVCASSKYLSLD